MVLQFVYHPMEASVAIVSRFIDRVMAYRNCLNFIASIVARLIAIVLVLIDCPLVGCNCVLAYYNCLEAYGNSLIAYFISMLLF